MLQLVMNLFGKMSQRFVEEEKKRNKKIDQNQE